MARTFARIVCTLAASGSSATAVSAARFAVACDGQQTAVHTATGSPIATTDPLSPVVYVVDEERRTVVRALTPLQTFEPVCGGKPLVSITPGLIRIDSSEHTKDDDTVCSFNLDRRTGNGTWTMKMTFAGGDSTSVDWRIRCTKTAIPVFQTRKNKF